MPKPRCRYYPEEPARRQCPAIQAPISARACREKYCAEIRCPQDCPHIRDNVLYETGRLMRTLPARLSREFSVFPEWLSDNLCAMVFAVIESHLARYGQWYPTCDDEEIRQILEDYEMLHRSAGAGLKYQPRYTAGRQAELRNALNQRITGDEEEGDSASRSPELQKAISRAVEEIYQSMKRHASEGPRGYLDFIILFAEKTPPKPSAITLI